MFIDKQTQFDKFIEEANKADAVAIDTEFIRDKTYWPKLCLLQMAIKDKHVLVDPFKIDIKSISKILKNSKLVKIFHAPRQDIEILHHKTGEFPNPLFDTQTAAAFLGHTVQVGYGHLVHKELGIKLKKGDSYTDWSLRPLSKSQLSYASDDVTYLHDLYYKIVKKLKEKKRYSWVVEDINKKFLDKNIYDVDPEERYLHLKRLNRLSSKQIAIAKEVSSWRERKAMKDNLPRKWVLSDDQIIEICKLPADSLDKLFRLRGMKKLSMDTAREIVDAVKKGLKSKTIPSINCYNEKHNNNFNNCEIDAEIDLMSSYVRSKAHENDVAPQVLSSNSDLSMIAHGIREGIPTLSGWRHKIVGKELLDLIDGKIALIADKGKVKKYVFSNKL